jgi:hypothetical protein
MAVRTTSELAATMSDVAPVVDAVLAAVRIANPRLDPRGPEILDLAVVASAGLITRQLGAALAPPARTGPLPVVPGYAPDPRQAAA